MYLQVFLQNLYQVLVFGQQKHYYWLLVMCVPTLKLNPMLNKLLGEFYMDWIQQKHLLPEIITYSVTCFNQHVIMSLCKTVHAWKVTLMLLKSNIINEFINLKSM